MEDKIDHCIRCAAIALADLEQWMERADETWGGLGLDRDDAEQEARVGALEAYDGFDPEKGELSTHLVKRARYALQKWREREFRSMGRERPSGDTRDMLDGVSDTTPLEDMLLGERRDLSTMAAVMTTMLPWEQQMVVRGRFGLDGAVMTWRELSTVTGRSVAKVMELYDAAMARLKAEMRAEEILGNG
jgi:DNA-directed RNA polymerase sigma subunit (sigma70/sigma32)